MKALDGPLAPTREDVLATLDLHAQELQRLGAKGLALFGSVARGEGSGGQ
jgi:predicted nucleotidyltransferase